MITEENRKKHEGKNWITMATELVWIEILNVGWRDYILITEENKRKKKHEGKN